jgi:hypothetical protein
MLAAFVEQQTRAWRMRAWRSTGRWCPKRKSGKTQSTLPPIYPSRLVDEDRVAEIVVSHRVVRFPLRRSGGRAQLPSLPEIEKP